MQPHYLHPSIIEAMNLSENEKKVFKALLNTQMASSVARLARLAGIPRTTAAYTIKSLQKRNVAILVRHEKKGKRARWKYNKVLSYRNRNFNEKFSYEETKKMIKKRGGTGMEGTLFDTYQK